MFSLTYLISLESWMVPHYPEAVIAEVLKHLHSPPPVGMNRVSGLVTFGAITIVLLVSYPTLNGTTSPAHTVSGKCHAE